MPNPHAYAGDPNNYQSCANHFSNRKFSKTEHAEEIEKVNRKMSEIGLDVKLSV